MESAVVDEEGTVRLGGVAYVQYHISTFERSPNGKSCYWCCAWSNLRLCDRICPWCKLDHVFIRQDTRKYLQ